jgi:hypothetical protein
MTLNACATIQFSTSDNFINSQYAYDEPHQGFLFGLVEATDPVNIGAICGTRKFQAFTSKETFLDGLGQVVTYGLYSPMNAMIYCQDTAKAP